MGHAQRAQLAEQCLLRDASGKGLARIRGVFCCASCARRNFLWGFLKRTTVSLGLCLAATGLLRSRDQGH
ncbi:hypothetical protein MRX96_005268 [Rhipicephalus microplus]